MLPGQLVQISAYERLLACDYANQVATALENFHATLRNIPTGGYGVLHAYRMGALLNAVVAACINELTQDAVWRGAFRYAAMHEFDGRIDMFIKSCLILIASACDDDTKSSLQSLLLLTWTQMPTS